MKTILLTFDIEEADILNEYGLDVDKEIQFETSKQGFLRLINLLDKHNIKATFFVTANFVTRYPFFIRELSEQGHEIACHGYFHSDNYLKQDKLENIILAKKEIEKKIKKEVYGFRAPRFQIKDIASLSNFGFKYDSSIHPTFISSKGKNLLKSRNITNIGQLKEIPLSTLPILRFPISWIAFRNLGLNYSKMFLKINNFYSDYTMLLFHPWEFADLKHFRLPGYIKKNTGLQLINMLDKWIIFAKERGYEFSVIKDYLGVK